MGRAIGSIIAEAGLIVVGFLPMRTAHEVNKYLNAVSEAFETMGTSWAEFAAGNTVGGIEAIYWGLRDITDSLMPSSIKDNVITTQSFRLSILFWATSASIS